MAGPSFTRPDSQSYVFTIASGQSTSNAIGMSGMVPVGLLIPAGGWNASSIAFQFSPTGGTFYNVYQWQNGGRLELIVTASSYTNVPYQQLLGAEWLVLQTTYTGVALAQTGARVITATVRAF